MKKLFYTLLALFVSHIALAQTITKNYVKTTTYQVKTQNGTTNVTTGLPITDDDKTESIGYFNGLGRPIQSIAKQAGAKKEDIITPVVYDDFGRQTRDYLPFARSTSSLNFENSLLPNIDGDITVLNNFYSNKYPDDFTGLSINDVNPFSEKLLEASPLNRVLKQGAPGKDWKVYENSNTYDHTVGFDWQTNSSNEVKLFSVSHPNGDTKQAQLDFQGYYDENELFKNITMDENHIVFTGKNHSTEEFTDKLGRLILKRTYNNNIAHDTYYVYDIYGNLTYVLSPEGSEAILDGSNNVLQSVLDKLCYQYRYDHRNRLIEKKIPGKGWEYIVYNKLDQPILTQDANLGAQNLWLFTKYDAFGRVAYTGTMSSSSSRGTLQSSVNGLVHKNETRAISYSTIDGIRVFYDNQAYPTVNIQELLTINYYDDYNWDTGTSFEASYSMTLSSGLELHNGNQIRKKLTSAAGWGNAGFKSQATITGDGYVQWTVTQTDKAVMVGLSRTDSAPNDSYNTIDYALYTGADTMSRVYIYEEGVGKSIPITNYAVGDMFKVERVGDQILYKKNDVVFYSSMTPSTGILLADSAFNHVGTIIEDVFIGYSVMGQAFSSNTKSLATGSKVRVLNTDEWITNVSYYDDKGRPIHNTLVNPYLGTTDATSSLLDFTGKVLKTHSTHKLGKVPIVTVDKFTYDHAGRLLRQVQSINSNAEQLITKNNYDELGQLVQKQVGGTLPRWSTYVNYAPNVSTTNHIITKTGGTNVWTDAGVATQESIQGDGYLSFKVTQVWNSFMAGLSYTDVNPPHYNSIKYAIYILAGGKVNVYESGANKGEKTSYVPGDIFSVERRGNSIYYLKNGEAFYASTVPTTAASMVGDVSILHVNTVIKDLVLVNLENTLQNVDYAYNIRGWLKNINDPSSLGSDLFGFQIGYNNPTVSGATALYNGNISETLWKTDNVDNSLKSYKYNYDALNRITVGQDNTVDGRYSVSGIGYDKNGNITNLLRNGHTAVDSQGMVTSFGIMDDMDYVYDGNQLLQVSESGHATYGFNDGNTSGNDYTYDVNGNMFTDLNKGIQAIFYNHLNLPVSMYIGGQGNDGVIHYYYSATGEKLSKQIIDANGGMSNITFYAGNFIYESNSWSTLKTLKFFNHPEGYVEPVGLGGFDYIYQYKDHLGNIRLSYKETASTSVNESFSGTTYDWVPPGSGSINSNNDKMNVNIANKWNAAAKYMDIIPGETLKISFDFDKGTMGNPYLFILERINGVWEAQANRDVFALQTGHFETELNLTGSHVKIYFEKGTAADDGTLTTCSVDNFSVSQTELEIIEENNYYPFGLKHKGYNNVVSSNSNSVASKFKYNGAELEEAFDINLYEMPLRQYDPAIARWTSIDPVTHHSQSTYNGYDNNPVFWADPSGGDVEQTENVTKYTGEDAKVAFLNIRNELNSKSQDSGIDPKNTDNCCGEYNTPEGFNMTDFGLKYGPKKSLAVRASSKVAADKYSKVKKATGGSGNNGVGDAVKHAFWMVQMTVAMGPEVAWEAGIANENSNESNTVFGRNMDINNNEWGINWALDNKEFLNNGSMKDVNRKFYSDLFEGIKSGNVIIKSADMHYVNDDNLQNIYKELNLN